VTIKENIVLRSSATPARRRRHHSGGSGLLGGGIGGAIMGASMHAEVIAPGIGGFIVGKLESSGVMDSLPDIPVIGDLLGKKGSAVVIMHVLKPRSSGIYRDVKMFLAGLSAYELAKEGKISGY
jgi:hypothetical protein